MNDSIVSDLQQRYAKMSPEEFAELRRENLIDVAVAVYDQEVERRNTPEWKEAESKYYQETCSWESSEQEYQKRLRKVTRLWQAVLFVLLPTGFLVFKLIAFNQAPQPNQALPVCVNLRCYNTWDEYLRKSLRDEAVELGVPESSEYVEKSIKKLRDEVQRSQDIDRNISGFATYGVLGGLGALLGWIIARLTTGKSANSQQKRSRIKAPWE